MGGLKNGCAHLASEMVGTCQRRDMYRQFSDEHNKRGNRSLQTQEVVACVLQNAVVVSCDDVDNI